MGNIKVAILGSTSHIAKSIVANFFTFDSSLHLYTRSKGKTKAFLDTIKKSDIKKYVIHEGYNDFLNFSYDVVINCIGVGTFNKLQGDFTRYFTVTEEYDNLVLEYLKKNPRTLYICISSGAVYGRECLSPADENTLNCIRVNHIEPEDYYSIVRINSEAKHRAFSSLRIIDLRIFSYFSRFIDLTDGYFITGLLNCVLTKKVFLTNNLDFVRDYLHPDDLYSMIDKCINAKNINSAFDVTSSSPVGKKEILDYFVSEYGLKYQTSQSLNHVSATGSKNIYCSKYVNAANIGYKPAFSSMDTIKQESKYILKKITE